MKIRSKIDLTDAMKEHIEGCSEHLGLDKNKKVISSKILISKEGKSFKVELNVELTKKKSIVVSKVAKDFYKGVNAVFDLGEKSIRNLHEKDTAIDRHKLIEPEVDVISDEDDIDEVE